eukprot:TRINITY_DN1439_c2_g2_i1.p1 TRINITY_DN1439_c2_g2~~TRINITY_DN1439_c2_g2_i1.p1  ORF type:complete len:127 (-),score=50.51 TRINITY_DN1439_c2_g2_i1:5-385(-)
MDAVLNANTKSSLIIQTLESKNFGLLLSHLLSSEEITIINSVKNLSSNQALQLLEFICNRLEQKQLHNEKLIDWTKNLLIYHTSFLATVPEASEILKKIIKFSEQSTSDLQQTVSLLGRLEVLLSE